MIMCFREPYGLTPTTATASELATINEERYRALTRSDVVQQGGDMDCFEEKEDKSRDVDEIMSLLLEGDALPVGKRMKYLLLLDPL